MAIPTPEQFRSLTRSSPWRWTTLRFTARWSGSDEQPVRAWVRRPDRLRVERLDGTLIIAGNQRPGPQAMAVLTIAGGAAPAALPWAGSAAPLMDAEGLVVARPSERDVRYDDPMYQTYQWVAMLDPVELADGQKTDGGTAPGTVIDHVRQTDHHGRLSWEAQLRPAPAYQPRCSCCALLFSAESEARWAEERGGPVPDAEPAVRYAEAHRVRLDARTGVCVLTEQIGGSRAGHGHELVLEAVDEPMPDELFITYPAASRIRRLFAR